MSISEYSFSYQKYKICARSKIVHILKAFSAFLNCWVSIPALNLNFSAHNIPASISPRILTPFRMFSMICWRVSKRLVLSLERNPVVPHTPGL
jgi:hypothetical protein